LTRAAAEPALQRNVVAVTTDATDARFHTTTSTTISSAAAAAAVAAAAVAAASVVTLSWMCRQHATSQYSSRRRVFVDTARQVSTSLLASPS